MELADFGFQKGCIVEVIVSTYGADGKPNAAPMGATMQNESEIALKLFNSTLTLKNLKLTKAAVLNVTSDINLFYKTTFKEVNPEGKLSQDLFTKSKTVNAPKLKAAEGTVEVTVKALTAIDNERTMAVCELQYLDSQELPTKAYCRAHAATIESLIHATRIKVFIKDEKRRETVEKLMALFNECKDIIKKTAPVSTYAEIMLELEERIELWKG
jgi:hypothetical protein